MKIFIYSLIIVALLAIFYDLFFMSYDQKIRLCKIGAEKRAALSGNYNELNYNTCMSFEEKKEKYQKYCDSANDFSKKTFCKFVSLD